MSATLDALNDAQARHAMTLFYDHLPTDAWDTGRKPMAERISTVVQTISKQADPAQGATVRSLLDDSNPNAQAAQAVLARMVLQQAMASPKLAPAAQQAIEDAGKANMFLDPVTGVIILGLLLATSNYDRDANGGLHIHFGANAAGILSALNIPETLAKLPAVIGALPAAVISRL